MGDVVPFFRANSCARYTKFDLLIVQHSVMTASLGHTVCVFSANKNKADWFRRTIDAKCDETGVDARLITVKVF